MNRTELLSKFHVLSKNLEIARVLSKINSANSEQKIKNEEIFGPINNETVIIVIQIHNRTQYLKQCLYSLSQGYRYWDSHSQ